jgi:2-isopropylmalate synthase
LAIASGATTINIPDTVGYTLPFEFGEIIRKVKNNVPNIDKAIISVHCHNDLGLAVANSLNAVENGARQIECTINGLGERAGNAALEEVVMAMKVRSDLLKVHTDINTEAISKTSKLVSSITGFPVQPNKAIVGKNAFAHESGIHQDGVLKNVETYEIMSPESIGLKKSSLVLGKHSGKHAFKEKLKILGYDVGDNYINEIFEKFKLLADRKKDVYDEDIIALVDDTHINQSNHLKLVSLSIMSGTNSKHIASLELDFKGESKEVSGSGNGPVDAVFSCISKVVGFSAKLKQYHINAITPDSDAQGEVTVKLEHLNREFTGKASDIDIIVASAKSYINACNKILNLEKNSNLQEGVSEISISNIKGI